jgi:exodeoxyribonuclease V beta subunit
VWDQIPLSGRSLIEASAGTGKTHAITTLVLRLLLERDRRLSEILFSPSRVRRRRSSASVSDPACGPPRGRSARRRWRRIVEIAPCSRAPRIARARSGARARRPARLDEAPILTLHGFCARVLAEHAFELGAPLAAEAVADDAGLAAAVVADFWGRSWRPRASPRRARSAGGHPSPCSVARRQAVARPDLELVPALAEPIDTAGPLSALMARGPARGEVWREERARWRACSPATPASSATSTAPTGSRAGSPRSTRCSGRRSRPRPSWWARRVGSRPGP